MVGILRSTGRGIGKVLGRIFDFRVHRWISYDLLKTQTKQTSDLAQSLFKRPKATEEANAETFEHAITRFNLTDSDLQQRARTFFQLALFYVFIAFALFSYALYLAYHHAFIATIMSLCLSIYALSQAFRFHFWFFQVKQRKLGCTFNDWLNASLLSGTKDS